MRETSSPTTPGKASVRVGVFDGSTVGADGKVETSQFVNVKQAEIIEKAGGQSVGTSVVHEVLESYIGAIDAPGKKIVTGNNKALGDEFNAIHDKAKDLDPEFQEMDVKSGTTFTIILPESKKEVDLKLPTPTDTKKKTE
mgnify:CR=1 FL=1